MAAAAPFIPYIVAAATAAGGAYQQHSVAKKQDQIAAQGIRQQAQKQTQANQQVNQLIDKTAASNPDAAASDARGQFMQQLAAARGSHANSIPSVGAASSRYTADAGTARGAADAYANNLADTVSQIDAPTLQRQQEGQQFARTGSVIGQIGNDAAGQDFLTRLRSRNVRANPWIDAAVQAGKGYTAAATPGSGEKALNGDYSLTPASYGYTP